MGEAILMHHPYLDQYMLVIIPVASIRHSKKVIKINLTTTSNFEILLSLMHRDINGVQVSVTPATPLSIFEHTMNSPRPS